MAEKRQSWPAVGSNFRLDDVESAIAKWGRLVMVRYAVETEGDYKGRAVRCWVGGYQVGTVEAARHGETRRERGCLLSHLLRVQTWWPEWMPPAPRSHLDS